MSDERRERVAKAISAALPSYMQARGAIDPTGRPPYWGPDGEGLQPIVDAALEAAVGAGEVVVSTDDLRALLEAVLDELVWVFEAYGGEYGSTAQGRTAIVGSTSIDFDMAIYDRLRAKVGEGT